MNIIDRDATEILVALARDEFSIPEMVAAHLDQIDAVNPDINAIISMRSRDDIMDEAQALQDGPSKGPLHGLPIAIKDLAETKGIKTTFGSPIFTDHTPTQDCIMVERLRNAGALIIGKTNTPEFGLGSHSYNPVHGITRNPYDLSVSAGGSSGGAGAALAARMVPIADGSDMMGSLRNPAAWNNIYGFRPSYGLVPDDPDGDSFLHQLSTSGPMARSVRDLELMLSVMGQPDTRNPHGMAAYQPMIDTSKPMKIGFVGDWEGSYPMENGVLDLCRNGLDMLSDLDCEVLEYIPDFSPEDLWFSWITLRSFAIAGRLGPLFNDPEKRILLKPEAIWEIEQGLALAPDDILKASAIRSDWFRYIATLNVDILALPSAQMFAFDADQHWPKSVAGHNMDTYHRWMEVVVPASLIGLPALSIPVGFGASGTPMGMQLIGKRGSDAQVLALGRKYDDATDFVETRPSIIDL